MLNNQKVPANLLTQTIVDSAENQLFELLTDITAEKISGGAISNPTTTDGTSEKLPSTDGNTTGMNMTNNPPGLGLTPFYPALPTPKLARLGHLRSKPKTSQ